MADYRAIPNAEVDPNAPVTSELAYAWRDNVLAIQEGAPGAPRIAWGAMGMSQVLGSGRGSPMAFTGIGAYGSVFALISCANASSNAIQVSTSSNGGGSWGGYQNITPAYTSGTPTSVVVFLDFLAGTWRSVELAVSTENTATGNGAITANPTIDAVRFRVAPANPVSVMLFAAGGKP